LVVAQLLERPEVGIDQGFPADWRTMGPARGGLGQRGSADNDRLRGQSAGINMDADRPGLRKGVVALPSGVPALAPSPARAD
jgi:hypothetical protein